MKIKKLDELFAECDNRAYQCSITYNQNMGLQINIYTKYLPTNWNGDRPHELYHDDWAKNSKKAVKKALKWLYKEDTFRDKKE